MNNCNKSSNSSKSDVLLYRGLSISSGRYAYGSLVIRDGLYYIDDCWCIVRRTIQVDAHSIISYKILGSFI